MEVLLIKKIFAGLTIVTLMLCAFVVSGQTHCNARAAESKFVGNACTAEALNPQTLWIMNEDHPGILNEKLIFATIVLGWVLIRRLLPIKVDRAKRLWIRAQEVQRERNLFYKNFLPYLFATHGW